MMRVRPLPKLDPDARRSPGGGDASSIGDVVELFSLNISAESSQLLSRLAASSTARCTSFLDILPLFLRSRAYLHSKEKSL